MLAVRRSLEHDAYSVFFLMLHLISKRESTTCSTPGGQHIDSDCTDGLFIESVSQSVSQLGCLLAASIPSGEAGARVLVLCLLTLSDAIMQTQGSSKRLAPS